MSDEKKLKYRLKRPIAMGGRREAGEIVEMTPSEAEGHGPEFVEKVKGQADKESKPSSAGEPESPQETGGEQGAGAEGQASEGDGEQAQPEGAEEAAGEPEGEPRQE